MRNDRSLKMAIDELKKEVSNVGFYINDIVTLPKDKKSFKNLMNAKLSVANIDRIMRQEIDSLEKEVVANMAKETHEKFKTRMSNINSPNNMMKKNADEFLNGSKALVKNAISEQIKKASDVKQQKTSSVGNR